MHSSGENFSGRSGEVPSGLAATRVTELQKNGSLQSHVIRKLQEFKRILLKSATICVAISKYLPSGHLSQTATKILLRVCVCGGGGGRKDYTPLVNILFSRG